MKSFTKIFTISAASALIIAGAVAIGVKNTDIPPVKVNSITQKAEASTPVEATELPSSEPATASPTTTTPEPTASATPSAADNKAKIMDVITEYAQSKDFPESAIYDQTACFDRIFTAQDLYGDYQSLLDSPLTQKFLTGKYYFDGAGTCRFLQIPKTVQQK